MQARTRTTLADNIVNQERVVQWAGQLMEYGVPSFDLDNPPWPDGYERTTREGGLFTRVEKWVYKTHNIKLYSADKAALSNGLAHAVTFRGLEAEVNNIFLWNPGDYGDTKSCFFGGKRQAWPILYKMGGMALKVYSEGKGVARALLLPVANSEDVYMFNAFGYPIEQMVAIYTKLFMPDAKAWPMVADVDGNARLPIHFNELGYTVGTGNYEEMVGIHFDAQAWYNRQHHRYHLFCEVCYNRIMVKAARSSGGYKHDAHLCPECYESVRASAGRRYDYVNLIKHELIGERTDDDPQPPQTAEFDFSTSAMAGFQSFVTGTTTSSTSFQSFTDTTEPEPRWASIRWSNMPLPDEDRMVGIARQIAAGGLEPNVFSVAISASAILVPLADRYPTVGQVLHTRQRTFGRVFAQKILTYPEALVLCLIEQMGSLTHVIQYLDGLLLDTVSSKQMLTSLWLANYWIGSGVSLVALERDELNAVVAVKFNRIFLGSVVDLNIHQRFLSLTTAQRADVVTTYLKFGQRQALGMISMIENGAGNDVVVQDEDEDVDPLAIEWNDFEDLHTGDVQ